jgi:hypothetical protein
MKTRTAILGSTLLLLAASAQAADIFRCTTPGGAVTYQQEPCEGAASGHAVNIASIYPDTNGAERDRLLQREAALDARLMKRAEIDAAERIARDDRLAREAQAQGDRAQEASAYVLARPLRVLRHAPRRALPAAVR